MVKNNEVLGYSKFTDKNNVPRLFLDVAKTPTDNDKRFGRVGMKVEQIWIDEALQSKVTDACVGKIIDCKYEVNGRFANVVDFAFN